LPVIPVSAIRRDRSNCINGCRACQIKCPADLEIANSAQVDHSSMGECFSCGACVGICPKGNVHNGFVTEKKHVLPWNVVRAVLFGLIFGLLTVWQTF
jgi:polyferredoxin